MKVIEQHSSFMWPFCIDADKACRLFQGTLGTENDGWTVTLWMHRAASYHIPSIRTTDLVPHEVVILHDLKLGDLCAAIRRGHSKGIRITYQIRGQEYCR